VSVANAGKRGEGNINMTGLGRELAVVLWLTGVLDRLATLGLIARKNPSPTLTVEGRRLWDQLDGMNMRATRKEIELAMEAMHESAEEGLLTLIEAYQDDANKLIRWCQQQRDARGRHEFSEEQ